MWVICTAKYYPEPTEVKNTVGSRHLRSDSQLLYMQPDEEAKNAVNYFQQYLAANYNLEPKRRIIQLVACVRN